ncbi:MAG: molecular chaperone HtpG [Spirochaetales bacterium]|nr:molecular chaperone HtpG [Spirochaetales bacterium]
MAKHKFQSEVNQLLHLIIHSLYSHKEIFLRELVSNSSDALDKLKFLTITDENFKNIPFTFKIDVEFSEEDPKTITITDTGIGMNEEDLVQNLGTIAKSGTKSFLENISGDLKKDSNLIGQFGVGFYSAFMVADKIEVISRKAGEENAFKWTSDGKGEYDIEPAELDHSGTKIILHLNEEGQEYANRWQIESTIKKYSNHIPFPIFLHYVETKHEEDDKKEKKEIKENKVEQINSASALWKKPKSELEEKDYIEFYKTISHDYDEPFHYVHTHAEGALQYSTLFYFPKKAPFDLFRVDFKPGVKLYVKRVFITDSDKELLPSYLRFVRGVIDTEDLPLNVSREILQKNRIMLNIRAASIKKILSEIGKLSADKEKYTEFYNEFKKPLKEGLYEDHENKDKLIELVMFKSTKEDGYVTLAEYKQRMQPDQKIIYYITGEKETNLRNSPLLEVYKKKDIEVLIMDDEIDEIIIPTVGKYKDLEFKSVNRADATKDIETEKDKEKKKELDPLVKKIKKVLKDDVKDVKVSSRLSDSPSCVVADDQDPTIQFQHIMKAMGQNSMSDFKPILEINPEHEIIKKLMDIEDTATIEDVSRLLLEQAILMEGVELKNPSEFVKRLNRVMGKAI